jgi:riboflavin kinase/FMN adenylyltransferase
VRLTDGRTLNGVANLGVRPMFECPEPLLEVWLFDFEGDLYGQEIEVEFVDFIRADRKFDSSEELITQMQADCERIRDILADH